MRSSLRIGKVLGIPIHLHYSWFLIFIVISFFLYFAFLDNQPPWLKVMASMGATLSLFASVMAHELSHSIVAIKSGIPVRSITLFFLGGVAQITREATRPMTELRMAIAGPLCSLILSGIFALLWYIIWGHSGQNLASAFDNPILWLAWINLVLALFNMIPGFPLDGGRILRSIIWQKTGSYQRATRIASLTGKSFAFFLIASGIIIIPGSIFTDILDPFTGVWFVFIGWFLHSAANSTSRQMQMRDYLHGFTAQSVMNTDYLVIPPHLSLTEMVQNYVLPSGRRYFIVADEGNLKGLITAEHIKKVSQTQWDHTSVSAIMTPADKVVSAQPGDPALSILQSMEEHGVNQIPVIRDEVIIGIVIRENLLRFIELRSELSI